MSTPTTQTADFVVFECLFLLLTVRVCVSVCLFVNICLPSCLAKPMFGLAAPCTCSAPNTATLVSQCWLKSVVCRGSISQKGSHTNIHTHTRMCNLDKCMLYARSVCGLLLHHDFGIKARSSGPVSLGSGAAHRPFEVAVIGVRFSSSHNNSAKLPAASQSSASLPWLARRNFVAV